MQLSFYRVYFKRKLSRFAYWIWHWTSKKIKTISTHYNFLIRNIIKVKIKYTKRTVYEEYTVIDLICQKWYEIYFAGNFSLKKQVKKSSWGWKYLRIIVIIFLIMLKLFKIYLLSRSHLPGHPGQLLACPYFQHYIMCKITIILKISKIKHWKSFMLSLLS